MVYLHLHVAVIGEPTSGKSAFSQVFYSNGSVYPKSYLMTMGVDFVLKDVVLNDDVTVEVALLDIGGQKLYDTLVESYLEHVSAFILIYDVSNKATFATCKRWITKARSVKSDMMGMLIANKIDLADKAEVTDSQGEIFARANKLQFYKCSALRGSGVNEPIENMASLFAEGYKKKCAQVAARMP